MTPPRLVEVECPNCRHRHWVIDHDFREMGGTGYVELAYEERRYECPSCGGARTGWAVIEKSPPEFLLQPHNMYPMTQAAFDHWAAILKANFPGHPRLAELGRGFVPRTPEEVQARKEAHARAHPVVEMRDQDGSRVSFPEPRQAQDWLEVMRPNDSLTFMHRDGGSVHVTAPARGVFRVRCADASGRVLAESAGLDEPIVQESIRRYVAGDIEGAVGHLRLVVMKTAQSNHGDETRASPPDISGERGDRRYASLRETPVEWHRTGDAEIPYEARVGNRLWRIRINDFPAEDHYSLLVDGDEIDRFNDWPKAWTKPK